MTVRRSPTRDYWETSRGEVERLGAAVRSARQAAMLSQPDLTAILNHATHHIAILDTPSLSRIESGTLIPSPTIATALSNWLINQSPHAILQALQRPVARSADPQTSHDAARTVTAETMKALHRWWMRHLALMWTKDPDQINLDGDPVGYYMTDEGARKYYDGPKVSDSGFRTRRAELRHAELVRDSGLRYPISTGRLAIAWELTPEGRAALNQETPPS